MRLHAGGQDNERLKENKECEKSEREHNPWRDPPLLRPLRRKRAANIM